MNYSIPTLLEPVLVHKNCIKVGVNIKSDFWKLQRDYQLGLDQIMIGDNSIVDLGVMANQDARQVFDFDKTYLNCCCSGKSGRWSLSRLSELLLYKPIKKEEQTSDWSKKPLSVDQKRYAAIDAFASLQLYYEIKTNAIPFGF